MKQIIGCSHLEVFKGNGMTCFGAYSNPPDHSQLKLPQEESHYSYFPLLNTCQESPPFVVMSDCSDASTLGSQHCLLLFSSTRLLILLLVVLSCLFSLASRGCRPVRRVLFLKLYSSFSTVLPYLVQVETIVFSNVELHLVELKGK